ncbi:hypothetical protein TUM4438_13290 [Shewanella sairae]|uniref:KAP NTPase domain-containing protein n=1 Tax=Shewanella sairae TaxID=190310 RepID=A0ABQ4P8A4_9GAMM|nr:antiviral RADAR system adenosine triphosphatase RdrA [Shewanella sairae]MCL1130671.1 KAP family NTPase [Shewanella sairae]GIU43730.1 hypothetical protein TUM4438_13290 [Shewanella sairae]
MGNLIELNLNKIDFEDSYENAGLWQSLAGKDLHRNLKAITKQAVQYSEKRKADKGAEPIQLHDTIFVSGGRGAGKTVFLKNAKKIWDTHSKCDDGKLHFCSTIDPTLLIDHDNFTNVVVAHLYNEIETEFSKRKFGHEELKSKFYIRLKQLAEALGQESEYEDRVGIDRIIKYRSGIQVERFFHDFVEICIQILDVDAIVVPIDDVDMALKRAFEVLDVVRRMLGCPFIIPIVSGDQSLYQHMVKQHFVNDTGSAFYKFEAYSDEARKGIELATKLQDSYLTKVFPNQHRISLLPASHLLPMLKILEGEGSSLEEVSFQQYVDKIKITFFGLTNGQEKSTDFPLPANSREVVQLIRLLPPSKLKKSFSWQEWESFRIWALSKKHGAAYTNADAAQALSRATDPNDMRLSRLLPFSPKNQASLGLSWANKNFYAEQLEAIEYFKQDETTKTNCFILDGAIDKCVLRSMPPLEMHTRRMTLSGNAIKDELENNTALYNLYTYKDYYGAQGNQIHKVFFSRAFELLATSLLMPSNPANSEEFKAVWFDLINNMVDEPPFYSIHAINPTRYTSNEESFASTSEAEQAEEPRIDNFQFSVTFSEELFEWATTHRNTLLLLEKESLIPLLHAVFNKVFTQLHLLRESHGKLDNRLDKEHLSDSTRRFEYIVVNAFASFLKKSHVVKSNVASSAALNTIRNHSKFIRTEHVFTRNVGSFVNLVTGIAHSAEQEGDAEGEIAGRLIAAIWDHPIFRANNSKEDCLTPRAPFVYIKPLEFDDLNKNIDNQKLESSKRVRRSLPETLELARSKGFESSKDILDFISNNPNGDVAQEIKGQMIQEINKNKFKLSELAVVYQNICKWLDINLENHNDNN